MGGQIVVGIRHTLNGAPEEVFISRWTNDIPWRFMTQGFLSQGQALREFIEEAQLITKKSLEPRLLKTPRLGEYGIILIDFVTRRVYSRQDFAKIGELQIIAYSDIFRTLLENTLTLIQHGMIEDAIPRGLANAELAKALGIPMNPDWSISEFQRHANRCLELDDEVGRHPFTTGATITLKKKVFDIDDGKRPRTLRPVHDWAQAQGWTTPFIQPKTKHGLD